MNLDVSHPPYSLISHSKHHARFKGFSHSLQRKRTVANVRLLAVQRIACQRTLVSFSFAAFAGLEKIKFPAQYPALVLVDQRQGAAASRFRPSDNAFPTGRSQSLLCHRMTTAWISCREDGHENPLWPAIWFPRNVVAVTHILPVTLIKVDFVFFRRNKGFCCVA